MPIKPVCKTITAATMAVFCCAAVSQVIPEESMLPCDEVEQEVLEDAPLDEVTRITAFTPAKIVERKNPRFPQSAAKKNREGWVKLSYVIDTEGNVKDPVVLDYTGDSAFKRSALSAVKQWQFSPAIKDGKPTEQCHQTVRLDFMLGNNNGATRRFVSAYKQANNALQDGDINKAEELFNKLQNGDYRNRYENAFLWSLSANIASQTQDKYRELTSIRRALSSAELASEGSKAFNSEYIVYLHQRQFTLEVNLNRFYDALHTAKMIQNLPNAEEVSRKISVTVEEIEDFIASDSNVVVAGTLNDSGSFFHSLVRNEFGFTDIEGSLNTLEVRCDTHREKFTVAEDFIWSIPQTWGQCQVLLKGASGATFNLVELNQA